MENLGYLPAPVYGTYEWQERANCREAGGETFFSPESERRAEQLRRETRAKAYCFGCEVISACLNHALLAHEPDGIWGGLNARERSERTMSRAHHAYLVGVSDK